MNTNLYKSQNLKSEISNKFKSKTQSKVAPSGHGTVEPGKVFLGFGIWNLFVISDLEFGIWV
jgi:hypothetical protein